MSDIWTLAPARAAIMELQIQGLRGNNFNDEEYSMDGHISIQGVPVYFYGDLERKEESEEFTVEVGFALKIDVSEKEEFKQLEQEFKALKKALSESISKEISLGTDHEAACDVLVPIICDAKQYPLVRFEGENAKELMEMAKKEAAQMLNKGVELASWYFNR